MLAVRDSEAPEYPLDVDWTRAWRQTGRRHVGAAHEKSMLIAEGGAHTRQCRFEALVHRLGRVEHRRVGQPEAH